MPTPTIELTFTPAANERYALLARFTAPGHDTQYSASPITLDAASLRPLVFDPEAYGQALTAQLFADEGLRAFWAKARTVALQSGELNVRLRFPTADPLLHTVRWETLRDPEDNTPFALSQRVRLARTIDGSDFTPLPLAPRPAELRALVAVTAPSDLDAFGLDEIDADGEVARVRNALGNMPLTVLGDVAAAKGRTTLEAIQAALGAEPQIVIIVAHSRLSLDGEPVIYLENEHGLTKPIPGDTFVDALQRQARLPLLLTLVSCKGAGDDYAALSAIGPRLAQLGIPAVLAFQGNIAMTATERLLPRLITEVQRDGQIDRALATARAVLGEGGPWWQPVLYLRGDGRLWREEEARQTQHGGVSIGGDVGTVQQINISGGHVESIIGSQINELRQSGLNTSYNANQSSEIELRKFEAAMPKQAQVGLSTEVRCMLALSDSKGLRKFLPVRIQSGDLIRRADVEAVEAVVDFAAPLITVYLDLTAPDFAVDEPRQEMRLHQSRDSAVLTFFLTPTHARPNCRVRVRLFQDPDYQTSIATVILLCNVREREASGGAIVDAEQLWEVGVGEPVMFKRQPTTVTDPFREVVELRKRLATHRTTLAHYLDQLSMVGDANARPEITAGIRKARAEIRRIKVYLRSKGQPVDDEFNDEEEDT
jgi:hypothetical protein